MDATTKGTVKWFNVDKGYGFIVPDTGEKDVFFHISAVLAAGLTAADIKEKMPLGFTYAEHGNRVTAVNLQVL